MLTLHRLGERSRSMRSSRSRLDTPYRSACRPPPTLPLTLPTVAGEALAGLRLYGFAHLVITLVFGLSGLLVHWGSAALCHAPCTAYDSLASALWYAGWTSVFIVPMVIYAIGAELRRFVRVRRYLGSKVLLDASGFLWSDDGFRHIRLEG